MAVFMLSARTMNFPTAGGRHGCETDYVHLGHSERCIAKNQRERKRDANYTKSSPLV